MVTPEFAPLQPSFAGKVALVAGASRGIGAVTAQAFARAGAAVVLAARDQQALDSVAEGIRGRGGQALAVRTDVSDPASVEHLTGATLPIDGGQHAGTKPPQMYRQGQPIESDQH
jgi:NAD(P)-dependent dehydrogenase (short-subunit alcohol dehydrogenase family)